MSSFISISAAPWYPLSAAYPYDDNLDLQPSKITWKDGYAFFFHPLFDHAKDVSINKQTVLYLTTAISLFDFFSEVGGDSSALGSYISLQLSGRYVTTDTETSVLYLSSTYLRSENFYRIYVNSDDGTYTLMQRDSLYVTVQELSPFTLYLTTLKSLDDAKLQRFNIYTHDNDYIYLVTKFVNPTPGYGPNYIERFVSVGQPSLQIRAIGMVPDVDDYNYDNTYLFAVTGFNLNFSAEGLTRDQTWVYYYNQLLNKGNNKNVALYEPKCISGIELNRLVDLPFDTKIDYTSGKSTMSINIASLKSIKTPEYEYNLRSSLVSAFEP